MTGLEENQWLQHEKLSSNEIIRKMFLDKKKTRNCRRKKNTDNQLRFHAQEIDSLYERFAINALCGTNRILSFYLTSKGQLKPRGAGLDEWLSPGMIVCHESDSKYRTGSIFFMDAD